MTLQLLFSLLGLLYLWLHIKYCLTWFLFTQLQSATSTSTSATVTSPETRSRHPSPKHSDGGECSQSINVIESASFLNMLPPNMFGKKYILLSYSVNIRFCIYCNYLRFVSRPKVYFVHVAMHISKLQCYLSVHNDSFVAWFCSHIVIAFIK